MSVTRAEKIERRLMSPSSPVEWVRCHVLRQDPFKTARRQAERWTATHPSPTLVHEVIMRLLTNASGKRYDPAVVEIVLLVLRERTPFPKHLLGEHVAFGGPCSWDYPRWWLADGRMDSSVARAVVMSSAPLDREESLRLEEALKHPGVLSEATPAELLAIVRQARYFDLVAEAVDRLEPGTLTDADLVGVSAMHPDARLALVEHHQYQAWRRMVSVMSVETWQRTLDGTGAGVLALQDKDLPGHLVDALAYSSDPQVRAAVVAHPTASEEAKVTAALLGTATAT